MDIGLDNKTFFQGLKFDEKGLIPVIVQDVHSNQVLMFAYMNFDSLLLSIEKKQMVYFSRSRNKLWHKGESSGHFQQIVELMLDCDADVILAKVEQVGEIACHTGHKSCFYRQLAKEENKNITKSDGKFLLTWVENQPVLKDPKQIYNIDSK